MVSYFSRPTMTSPASTIVKDATTEASVPCVHKEASFSDGNGYAKLKPKAIGRLAKDDKLEVKIEFTTSESDGIIIWQGSTNTLQHWLAFAGMIIDEKGLH